MDKVLQIIDEEFDLAAAKIDPGYSDTLKILMSCEKRIVERIKKECIEIPEEDVQKITEINDSSTRMDIDEARGSFLADYVDGYRKHHGGW